MNEIKCSSSRVLAQQIHVVPKCGSTSLANQPITSAYMQLVVRISSLPLTLINVECEKHGKELPL